MKTLKVEAVHRAEHECFADVAADLLRFIDEVCNRHRLRSALGHHSPSAREEQHALQQSKPAA